LNFANDMFRVLVSRLKDCAQMDIADLGRLLESAATAQKIARLSPDASITNEVPAHAEADQMEDFDLERLSSEDIDALDQLLSKAHKNGGRVHCRPHGIDVTWQN
jgi:hypothetical protein